MSAIVVYQSLWGNTAAIAKAIAEGIGTGARVGHTGEISAADAASATLLVVGAPVHAFRLPTAESVDSVKKRAIGPDELAPTVEIPLLRDWILALDRADQAAAAFDTRIKGPLGHGGVSSIEKALSAQGRRIVGKGEGFVVINQKKVTEAASMLKPGELERAAQWGKALAASL